MKKSQIKRVMAISSVVLMIMLIFTQVATSAKIYEVIGKPTSLGEYKNGHADVALDTNGDGNGNWPMDLYMNQEHYNTIRDAKREGKQVLIKYHFKNGEYRVIGVQLLSDIHINFVRGFKTRLGLAIMSESKIDDDVIHCVIR